jgi:hypothetical protein
MAAQGGLMKRLIFAVVIFATLAGSMFAPLARAQTLSTGNLVNLIYGLKICKGTYALCAASTCTPTGGTIEANTATGTNIFAAASCTCPVYDGEAIADPNGGNMKGSCNPPGSGQVWSLYAPKSNIPQAVNNWSRKAVNSAVTFQLCSSTDDVGSTFANFFSFACTLDRKRQNGVRTATCTCPLGEDLNGEPVDAATAVVTPAGQCNSSFCTQHPVGAPLAALDGNASECLASENSDQIQLPSIDN